VANTFKVSALKTLRHTVFPKPIIDENLTLVRNEENISVNNDKIASSQEAMVSNKIYIKSGSFFSAISPAYLETIHNNGFSYLIQKVKQDKKIIRRVFIGPFNSIGEAKEALVIVRAKINEFAYIQRNIK